MRKTGQWFVVVNCKNCPEIITLGATKSTDPTVEPENPMQRIGSIDFFCPKCWSTDIYFMSETFVKFCAQPKGSISKESRHERLFQ